MSKSTDIESINNNTEHSTANPKYILLTYNIVGFLVGFYLLFGANVLSITIALLYPLLGIALNLLTKGWLRIVDSNSRSRDSLNLGFMVTIIFVLINGFVEYRLFQSNHLWLPFIIITLAFLLVTYPTGAFSFISNNKVNAVAMVVMAIAYGYGSTRMINCAFDASSPSIYKTTVVGKRESRGRHTSYYATLMPWGPMQNINTKEIDGVLYDQIKIDDTLRVNFRPGLFAAPWFIITKN